MQKEYTVAFLFSHELKQVIMQLKIKGPYINKWNGVGGKVEIGEHYINGISREVIEETCLTADDFINFGYLLTITFANNVVLHVFYGQLKEGKTFTQIEEEKLQWFEVEAALSDYIEVAGGVSYFIQESLQKLHSLIS